jgi:hypothetical protein
MIPLGSSFLVSSVDRAVTPNPCIDQHVPLWSSRPPSAGGLIRGSVRTWRRHANGLWRQSSDMRAVTHQWHIRHVVHHHTLMFWCILRYPTQVSFDDVIPVQEGQLSWLLHPDLSVSNAQGSSSSTLDNPMPAAAVPTAWLSPLSLASGSLLRVS